MHFTNAAALIGNNVIYITAEPRQQAAASIPLDSVRIGMDEFHNYRIAFVYSKSATATNGSRNADVLLSQTNNVYFSLANHWFTHGRQSYAFEASNSIVLSENAAMELFGSTDVMRFHVDIDEQAFEISGVIAQNNPSEPNFAWIPYSSEITHVSGIYIGAKGYSAMQLHTFATQFVYAAGLDSHNLRFISLDQYAYNILVRFNLLLILVGGLSIIFLATICFRAIEASERRKAFVFGGLALIFVLLCVFVWRNTEPLLPLNFEPYEFSPFIDSLANRHTFDGLSYLSRTHQALHELNQLSNYPLLVGSAAFAGTIALGFIRAFKSQRLHSEKRIFSNPATVFEYVLTRIIQAIPAFFIMTFVIFSVMSLMRGGQVRNNLLMRYIVYILAMLQGDFGVSMGEGGLDRAIVPITELLLGAIPTTAVLVTGAIIIASVSGTILGIIAALKHNKLLDHAIMVFTLFASSIPIFFLGALLLLIVSGERLGWITEYASLDNWRTMVLPIITLALPSVAFITRTTRTAMLSAMKAQYITAARGRGLPEWKLTLYAIDNVRVSVINITALQLIEMFMGTVIVEEVFGILGLGRHLLWAINFRDQELMMGIIIVFSLIFMIINLVVDVVGMIIDPRVAKTLK